MATRRATHRDDRLLRGAAVLFAVGFAFHTADHLRRGTDSITTELLWAGNATSVISIVVIVMVLTGNRWAPPVAAVAGFALAAAFAASHLLPHWSELSDSFVDNGASAVSWAAVLMEIVGAVALGVAGVYETRRRARAVSPLAA
jgi:hypothetical protein